MHAEDGIHWKKAKEAVIDHFFGAALAFFGRLEYDVHGTVEIAVLCKITSGRQQHGRVPIVAASTAFSPDSCWHARTY